MPLYSSFIRRAVFSTFLLLSSLSLASASSFTLEASPLTETDKGTIKIDYKVANTRVANQTLGLTLFVEKGETGDLVDVAYLGNETYAYATSSHTLTYTPPAFLTQGTYILSLKTSANPSGETVDPNLILGILNYTPKLPPTTFTLTDCKVHANNKEYLLSQGPDVDPKATPTVVCPFTGSLPEGAVATITTYDRLAGSGVAGEPTKQPFTVKDNTITFPLVLSPLPQAYTASIDLSTKEGSRLSLPIPAHYVVRGLSATVHEMDYTLKDSTLSVSANVTGPADNFPEALKPTKTTSLTATFILSQSGKTCSSETVPVVFNASSSETSVRKDLTYGECSLLTLQIKDSATDTILSSKTLTVDARIPTTLAPVSTSTPMAYTPPVIVPMYLYAILAVLVLAFFLGFLIPVPMYKHGYLLIIGVAIVSLAVFSVAKKVEAAITPSGVQEGVYYLDAGDFYYDTPNVVNAVPGSYAYVSIYDKIGFNGPLPASYAPLYTYSSSRPNELLYQPGTIVKKVAVHDLNDDSGATWLQDTHFLEYGHLCTGVMIPPSPRSWSRQSTCSTGAYIDVPRPAPYYVSTDSLALTNIVTRLTVKSEIQSVGNDKVLALSGTLFHHRGCGNYGTWRIWPDINVYFDNNPTPYRSFASSDGSTLFSVGWGTTAIFTDSFSRNIILPALASGSRTVKVDVTPRHRSDRDGVYDSYGYYAFLAGVNTSSLYFYVPFSRTFVQTPDVSVDLHFTQ